MLTRESTVTSKSGCLKDLCLKTDGETHPLRAIVPQNQSFAGNCRRSPTVCQGSLTCLVVGKVVPSNANSYRIETAQIQICWSAPGKPVQRHILASNCGNNTGCLVDSTKNIPGTCDAFGVSCLGDDDGSLDSNGTIVILPSFLGLDEHSSPLRRSWTC